MNDVFIAILTSGAFSAIVSSLIARFEKKDKLQRSLVALMGFQIRDTCEKIIKQKKTTLSEFRQLQELNSIYHELGGNGYVKALMEKVSKAEIVED